MTVCFIHDSNLWGVFALVSEREIPRPTDLYSYIQQQSWNNERQISAVMIKHDISPRLQSLWECLTWSISWSIPPTTPNFSTASLHICHFSSPQRLQTAAQTRTGHCSLLRKSKGIFPVSKGQAGTRAQCTVSPGQMALHHFRQSGCTRQADQTMSKWIWCFFFFLSFFLGSRGEQPLMIFSQLYLSATSDRHRVFLIDRFECASRTLRRPSRIWQTKAHTMPTHAAFEAFNFLGFDSNSFFFPTNSWKNNVGLFVKKKQKQKNDKNLFGVTH